MAAPAAPKKPKALDELRERLREAEEIAHLSDDQLQTLVSLAAIDGTAANDRAAKWAQKILADRGITIGQRPREQVPFEQLLARAIALEVELAPVLHPQVPPMPRRPGPQFLEDLLEGREPGKDPFV